MVLVPDHLPCVYGGINSGIIMDSLPAVASLGFRITGY